MLRVHLPSDIPIVGCELTPYVLLRRPNKDKPVFSEDVTESAPVDGYFLRYKWSVGLIFFSFLWCILLYFLACDLILLFLFGKKM